MIDLNPGYEARLCAYAKSVANFPTALKEFKVSIKIFNGFLNVNCYVSGEMAGFKKFPSVIGTITRLIPRLFIQYYYHRY